MINRFGTTINFTSVLPANCAAIVASARAASSIVFSSAAGGNAQEVGSVSNSSDIASCPIEVAVSWIDKGVVYASNISSDKASGIGSYSNEDLRKVIDEGKGKSGRTLFVMPWSYYKGMTNEDKDALIAALREEPPIPNIVTASTVK